MDEKIITIRVEGLTLAEICQKLGGKQFGENEYVRAAAYADLFDEVYKLEEKLGDIND